MCKCFGYATGRECGLGIGHDRRIYHNFRHYNQWNFVADDCHDFLSARSETTANPISSPLTPHPHPHPPLPHPQ